LSDESAADLLVYKLASDWTQAQLSPENRKLCEFAEKLTKTPDQMSEQDIINLRNLGLCDQSIHDATQIISYFNYINRVADSLDVDFEEEIHSWELSVPKHEQSN